MIICIGEEEFELEDLISQVEFDIVKLDSVINGLVQFRDNKASTLDWLVECDRYCQ